MMTNESIARALDEIAAALAAQKAGTFRIRAYRSAAGFARECTDSLAEVLETRGREGLVALPHIGDGIAAVIDELVHTGRTHYLDRLRGQVSPEDLFTRVPGIGEKSAERLHRELGIETLEELELAAHDGRLAALPGFGPKRIEGVRQTLAGLLSRSARRHARQIEERAEGGHDRPPADVARPDVGLLLAIDAEYRRRADEGSLRLIAPRRFNPEGTAWLPVLHEERDGWHFTAMFSNTARAHELGNTRDWVVIYYDRDGHENQCTVVTEHRGTLAGHRVVRGREDECRDLIRGRGADAR